MTRGEKFLFVLGGIFLAVMICVVLVKFVVINIGIFIWIFLAIGAFVVGIRISSSERLTFTCASVAIVGSVGLAVLFYDSSIVEWLFAPFGDISGAAGLSSTLWDHTLALQAYYFVAAPFALSTLWREP